MIERSTALFLVLCTEFLWTAIVESTMERAKTWE